jgi:hypothetical protein
MGSERSSFTRKRFLRLTAGGLALGAVPRGLAADTAAAGHPNPRPGVDGSAVLDGAAVRPDLAPIFDGIRAIPHIADGIGCHCGCGAMPEMRSLLSCYEGIGMAQFCVICEGEGRLAVSLHGEGRSLDEIRAAIDRRFG